MLMSPKATSTSSSYQLTPSCVETAICLLPPSLNICYCWHKFDSICKKYVQLYLEINLLKKLDLDIFPMKLIIYYKY